MFYGIYKQERDVMEAAVKTGLGIPKHINAVIIALLVLCSLPAVFLLLRPGMANQIDLVLHLARFSEFNRAIEDGQLPPLWAPNFDAGYGNPTFIFYSPLFFFSAQIPRLLGFSYLACIKMLVILSMVLSGISMYIFTREFWGKAGAFLSAIAYVYAPYHLMDVYARGAFTENIAFVWFPLILWLHL